MVSPTDERKTAWIASLAAAVYAWLATVFFGLSLLDIIYARLVPDAALAFAEVADFLLLVNGATVLAAVVAIALSWRVTRAQRLLIASLAPVVLSLVGAPVLSPFLQGSPATGAALRIVLTAAMSLLAFSGFVMTTASSSSEC